MASGSYLQSDITCPYYRYDDGKRAVTCEGVTDRSVSRQIFKTAEECRKYMEHYCIRHNIYCTIYKMLESTHYD